MTRSPSRPRPLALGAVTGIAGGSGTLGVGGPPVPGAPSVHGRFAGRARDTARWGAAGLRRDAGELP
jgi:hypothetical protein